MELSYKVLPTLVGCDVDGEHISPHQANDILVRTCSFPLISQDLNIRKSLEHIFYSAIDKTEWGNLWWLEIPGESLGDQLIRENRMTQYQEQMGILDLRLLSNNRVCSSRVGGLYGWCDWNGEIYQRGRNVGLYPTMDELLNEWEMISCAFPYLNLRCKILGHMAGCPEDAKDKGNTIEIVYEVSEGLVKMRDPIEKDYLGLSTESDIISMGNVVNFKEEFVDLERWELACKQVSLGGRG